MPYLELLWILAVLGWIPLIYADELSALAARRRNRVRVPPRQHPGDIATRLPEAPADGDMSPATKPLPRSGPAGHPSPEP